MRLALYALLLFLAAGTSFGQTPDSVYTIGEITVTAAREGLLSEDAPQRVTVLGRDDVRSTSAESVAELLASRAGLFIRHHGEGLATVSLRGSSPSQTLLLIDGMRLADPQLGQFDLSLLPSYVFGSIEIVHGPGSALYGTDGMAGVINLRRRRTDRNRVHLLTRAGAFGERLATGGWAFSEGSVSGMVAAEYGRADGDFPYFNAALFPAREARRRNADREKRSIYGTLSADLGPHRIRGSVLYADAERGLPGLAGTPPLGERQWDELFRVWVEDRFGRVTLRSHAHRGALRYQHPPLGIDDVGRTWLGGVEGELRYPAGKYGHVIGGASAGYAAADHPSLSARAEEIHGAVFISGTGSYGAFKIYPALRADGYVLADADAVTAVSPRLGVNIQPLPHLPLHLKANAARAFRVPTFNDRFWQPGGNPDLRPERARSIDSGVHALGTSFQAELTGFASETIDQIVWLNLGGDRWSPRNLSRVVVHGLEASFELDPASIWTAGFLYTFTRARDRSSPGSPSFGRQLRYVPLHQAKGYASVSAGPFSLHLNAKYIGRRFVTSDETESLGATMLVDAQVDAAGNVGPVRLRLSFGVENLLDARYAVIKDYPMPPRHARLSLLIETSSN